MDITIWVCTGISVFAAIAILFVKPNKNTKE